MTARRLLLATATLLAAAPSLSSSIAFSGFTPVAFPKPLSRTLRSSVSMRGGASTRTTHPAMSVQAGGDITDSAVPVGGPVGPPAPAIIMGGGFSGLAQALALRKIAGLDVKVFEHVLEDKWRKDGVGSAIVLSPNGQQALEMISPALLQKAKERGQPISRQTWNGYTQDSRMEEWYGHLALCIQWSALREVLASFLEEGDVQCGSELVGYKEGEGGVEAEIETPKGKQTVTGCMLIGADGIRSSVRPLIKTKPSAAAGGGGDAKAYLVSDAHADPPLDSASTIIRVVLPVSLPEYSDRTFAGVSEDKETKMSIFPVGEGRTYWAVTLKDPQGVYMEMDREELKDLMLQRAQQYPDLCELITTTPTSAYTVSRLPYLPLQETYARGRTALIGDAAHAMFPTYGQGAGTSFEDAVQLALCVKNGRSVAEALAEYSTVQRDRAGFIQSESQKVAERVGPGRGAVQQTDEEPRFRTQMEFQEWLNNFRPLHSVSLTASA